jgi:hypothetical protein
MNDFDMPETDSPNMVQIRISVPAPLLEEAIAVAKAEGWPQATLWRNFWIDGFHGYCEASNKRRVNRQLRDKQSSEAQ